MPLGHVLDFQLAHARARDAVHAPLDVEALIAALAPHPSLTVRSLAPDRATFLKRPDLGRRLDPAAALAPVEADAVFVIGDGLSARAVAQQAAPLLHACAERLTGWRLAPVVIAQQARVALGDPIGEALGVPLCAMLIGERPGLSVADSLGVYLTYQPRTGRRDSERNCISNIHGQGGLSCEAAADRLVWLMTEARHRRLTGVGLKEEASRRFPAMARGHGGAIDGPA
jgi:ethanolamine ammonia-lyase small subunit